MQTRELKDKIKSIKQRIIEVENIIFNIETGQYTSQEGLETYENCLLDELSTIGLLSEYAIKNVEDKQ